MKTKYRMAHKKYIIMCEVELNHCFALLMRYVPIIHVDSLLNQQIATTNLPMIIPF